MTRHLFRLLGVAAIAVALQSGSSFSAEPNLMHQDGVAAVVGDEIILYSEVEAYMLLRLNALKVKPDSADYSRLRKEFLQELIEGKVLLVHARKDTTIVVKNDDVEQTLDDNIARFKAENSLSDEAFEKELSSQGLTMQTFRAQQRKALKEQLYKQNLLQAQSASVKVNKKDVEDFYVQYKDSLPPAGPSVRLLKIALNLAPPDSVRRAAFKKITAIKTRLNNGEPFADLAQQFSQDPNAESGGDLGFIAKGTLNELAFEEHAFALKPGEVSEPFETRLGWHIISVAERKEQRVHVRQIFVPVAPPDQLRSTLEARLDSVRAATKNRDDFVKAVLALSQDAQSRARNGDIGWTSRIALPSAYSEAFDSLYEGAVSKPVRDGNTLALLMVDKIVAERTLTPEDDWSIIEEKARDIFAQKRLVELVKKWRSEMLVDVRL